jgi:hypothetical protein
MVKEVGLQKTRWSSSGAEIAGHVAACCACNVLSSFKPFNPTRTHSGLKLLLLDSDETQNLMNYRLGFQKFKMFLPH